VADALNILATSPTASNWRAEPPIARHWRSEKTVRRRAPITIQFVKALKAVLGREGKQAEAKALAEDLPVTPRQKKSERADSSTRVALSKNLSISLIGFPFRFRTMYE